MELIGKRINFILVKKLKYINCIKYMTPILNYYIKL